LRMAEKVAKSISRGALAASSATSAWVGFWPRARRRSPKLSRLIVPVPFLSKWNAYTFIYTHKRQLSYIWHSSFSAQSTRVSNPIPLAEPSSLNVSFYIENCLHLYQYLSGIKGFYPSTHRSKSLTSNSSQLSTLKGLYRQSRYPLNRLKMNNACLPCLTATAGTWVGQDLKHTMSLSRYTLNYSQYCPTY